MSSVSPYAPIRRRPRRRPFPTSAAAVRGREPVLAARATELARAVATGAIPPRWRSAEVTARVERVRAQLAPLFDRATLAASWRAEAQRHLATAEHDVAPPGPLDLAYAVRWLELEPSAPAPIPAWSTWVAGLAD